MMDNKRAPRKTAKLMTALRVVGLRYSSAIDQETIYAHAAARGYRWDGQRWVRVGVQSVETRPRVQIRVMGIEDEALFLADYISNALHQDGAELRMSKPQDCTHEGQEGQVRIYIDVFFTGNTDSNNQEKESD